MAFPLVTYIVLKNMVRKREHKLFLGGGGVD